MPERATRLHCLRLLSGRTRRQVADAVGISTLTLQNLELDPERENPTLRIMSALSAHYHTPIERLLGRIDFPLAAEDEDDEANTLALA